MVNPENDGAILHQALLLRQMHFCLCTGWQNNPALLVEVKNKSVVDFLLMKADEMNLLPR